MVPTLVTLEMAVDVQLCSSVEEIENTKENEHLSAHFAVQY